MPNRLHGETSPYLLQHADNPVAWYPWGEAALEAARSADKPIFLSIGYSACHWCHVMAHESFQDPATAAVLNEHFVSIKVDREERPDLDHLYMAAVQAMTGSGGWPMSVFLTPEGHPFYGGTYFPPQPRYGMPSFVDVLVAVADAWRHRRDKLLRGAQRLGQALDAQWAVPTEVRSPSPEPQELALESPQSAFEVLRSRFDRTHGGWNGAPKFPQPMVLEFLMRFSLKTGHSGALEMVTQTLYAMARGGLYDQLGGGFHRYSVDEQWLKPHFERMLYDQAQLARAYLHAWQLTADPFHRDIAREILDYVVREMTDPQGGFYSAQDADSEGEEGSFYLWTPEEIRCALPDETVAQRVMQAYGVHPAGNFDGRSILEFMGDMGERAALSEARHRLLLARERRPSPGVDDKVLTAWNGLMLAAFSEAARALDCAEYRQAARRNAVFVLGSLSGQDGRLLRSWRQGTARLSGYLEDYGCLIDGLLELYQTTFESRWYRSAHDLAECMIAQFTSPDGTFFDTGLDHETLIRRSRNLLDSATPSGSAAAVTALLKLAGLSGEVRYVKIAQQALAQVQSVAVRAPLGFGQWLQALTYTLSVPSEIAIVGHADAPDTQALLAAARAGYRPFQVVALGAPGLPRGPVPLLAGRDLVEGRAAAYVCRGFTCRAPIVEAEVLRRVLDAG